MTTQPLCQKARPILFSTPMVQALLAGRKTQTRRIVKPPKQWPENSYPDPFAMPPAVWWWNGKHHHVGVRQECPHGRPGDLLWVRETWAEVGNLDPGYLVYRATYPHCLPAGLENVPADIRDAGERWRPSIHMPRWASRLTLRITDVRVQRLQEISQADAQAEGAPPSHPSIDMVSRDLGFADFPRSWFAQLWDSINGDGAWGANTWVWTMSFEVIAANVCTVLQRTANFEKEK